MNEVKPKKQIAAPWESEVEIVTQSGIYTLDGKEKIRINLISILTGEIRQKNITVDQIARVAFKHAIKNSGNIFIEDIIK